MSADERDQGDSRFSLELVPGTRIAVFHWVGPINLEDRLSNCDHMLAFCLEHNVSNIIVDGRDQESQTGTIEAFSMAKEVPLRMPGLRIAVVHRTDDDALPFIETVANNRGQETRAFTDFDEVRKWLASFGDTSVDGNG